MVGKAKVYQLHVAFRIKDKTHFAKLTRMLQKKLKTKVMSFQLFQAELFFALMRQTKK